MPDIRHRHHVGTLKQSLGLLDKFRSMVFSPGVIVGVPLSQADYINLPFQPEQRLRRLPHSHTNGKHQNQLLKDSSSDASSCYTVKSRRKHSSDEKQSNRRHSSTTTSILTSIHHPNILYASDLQPPTIPSLPQISHIHLGTVIHQAGKQSSHEADCYIAQLISGLSHLHKLHITHRDICPSNLLLTSTGTLKISNFASSEHLKASHKFKSSKRCGTIAYIAPEVFIEKEFDGRAVDVWAVGVVYLEMRCGRVQWEMAAEGADEGYDGYLRERSGLWGFRPVENLRNGHCRSVIRNLLNPCPEKRMTASQILNSRWYLETELCAAAVGEEDMRS